MFTKYQKNILEWLVKKLCAVQVAFNVWSIEEALDESKYITDDLNKLSFEKALKYLYTFKDLQYYIDTLCDQLGITHPTL